MIQWCVIDKKDAEIAIEKFFSQAGLERVSIAGTPKQISLESGLVNIECRERFECDKKVFSYVHTVASTLDAVERVHAKRYAILDFRKIRNQSDLIIEADVLLYN